MKMLRLTKIAGMLGLHRETARGLLVGGEIRGVLFPGAAGWMAEEDEVQLFIAKKY